MKAVLEKIFSSTFLYRLRWLEGPGIDEDC